jgi:hypothetical protein
MKIFNLLKKKEKKIEKPNSETTLSPEKILKLKKERNEFLQQYNSRREQEELNRKQEIEKSNNTCPKCKSTNVIDKISRNEGHLEGSSHGSGSLFGGFSSYGHIKGDWDTNPVNKCVDCNNEWKKTVYVNNHSHFDSEMYRLSWFCQCVDNIKNTKFDPLDLSERFETIEEKRASYKEKLDEYSKDIKLFWGDSSIELIDSILKNYIYRYDRKSERINFEYLKEFLGFKNI